MDLSLPISHLPMVGPTYAKKLQKLGITTIEDLLLHLPHRYEDLSLISKIGKLQPGETVTVQGEVVSSQNVYTKWGKKIQRAIIADSTGQIEATWFNQPYLAQTLKPGTQVALAGKVSTFGFKTTLQSPEYEIINRQELSAKRIERNNSSSLNATPYALRPTLIHTGRLVPIYPETHGVSSKWLRSRIAPLLTHLPPTDHLPSSLKEKYNLTPWADAIRTVHFPPATSYVPPAIRRLAFDELLFLHLATLIRKKRWQHHQSTHPLHLEQDKILAFISNLPFKLTPAQNSAIKDILADLTRPIPMNRLLEGDVGSGKTVVAAAAIYACFLNGFQAALMAPTQILAHQHETTLRTLLEPLGVTISLVTSGQKPKAKSQKQSAVLIGTHALLHHPSFFANLALVVIDEQHRFGVEQRAHLMQQGRGDTQPHLLTMTATPIPRTIALTLYGNLDLSLMDEMPPGRKPPKTWVVPPQKRASAYHWIANEIRLKATQAFIVCPLIEQSQVESMAQVKAATIEYKQLKHEIFPNFKLGLLHGRLKAKDKNTVISQFARRELDLLVTTPVVEVGIDIPQASIILIEAAERFGLAQLHQLRGRVGRRGQQGYCLLFTTTKSNQSLRRLKALETETSGLKLAEIDLKLRGPGELYGTRQHGFVDLKIASFADSELISLTHQAATDLLITSPDLARLPLLKQKVSRLLSQPVEPNQLKANPV